MLSAELSAELAADDAVSDDEASFEEAVELVPFELHAVSVAPARAAVSINDKIFFHVNSPFLRFYRLSMLYFVYRLSFFVLHR